MAEENAAFQRGKACFEQKDYAGAEREFRAAVQTEPARAECHAWLARALRCQNKNHEAISVANHIMRKLETVDLRLFVRPPLCSIEETALTIVDYTCTIHLAPEQSAVNLARADAFREMGSIDRAMHDYDRTISLDPGNASAYFKRGCALAWRSDEGDAERALADYSHAIEVDPKLIAAYLRRGNYYCGRSDFERGIRDLTRAIELDSDDPATYDARAFAYHRLGDLDHAITDYTRAIEIDPRNGELWHERGDAHRDKGRYDCAIADYSQAIEFTYPEDRRGYLFCSRGQAHHFKGDLDQAIADYSYAITLGPAVVSSYAYNGRGVAYHAKGDIERAIADYTQAIEIQPENALVYLNRAKAFSDQGENDRAATDLRRATEIQTLCTGTQEVATAAEYSISDYDRATELDAKSASAYNNRGVDYANRGDHDRAIADYNRAIQMDSRYANAYNNRALARQASGDIEGFVADRARYHRWSGPDSYSEDDATIKWAWDYIQEHLVGTLLPRLRSAGEQVVDYYPCSFTWGRRSTTTWRKGTSTHGHFGKYGFGYLCLSDRGVHLVSLGETSRKLLKNRSILLKAVFAAFGQFDFQHVEKDDQYWMLPYGSIAGAQRNDAQIALAGASEVFDIEPYYNHYDRILTGIAMGRQGKFQHLWDAPAVSRPAAPTMSQAEVIAALEKLAGLKEKGILTDAEYQEQKKKLLAQT